MTSLLVVGLALVGAANLVYALLLAEFAAEAAAWRAFAGSCFVVAAVAWPGPTNVRRVVAALAFLGGAVTALDILDARPGRLVDRLASASSELGLLLFGVVGATRLLRPSAMRVVHAGLAAAGVATALAGVLRVATNSPSLWTVGSLALVVGGALVTVQASQRRAGEALPPAGLPRLGGP